MPGSNPLVLSVDTAEDVVFNATSGNDVITLGDADDDLLSLTSEGTFEGGSFSIPTASITINAGGGDDVIIVNTTSVTMAASLTINGESGTDSVSLAGAMWLVGGNLAVYAESISVAQGADITSTGDVTFTAIAENNLASSSSPDSIDISAQILVDGVMKVDGSLILEATVNNTVDLDAWDASLEIESQSNAVAQIGSSAKVEAGNLTVSAVTNTNFSVDIANATSGGSGLGEAVVDGGRGNLTPLQDTDSADFYLWKSTTLDTLQPTYVVTHGWRDGLHNLDTWIPLLNSLKQYEQGANVVFTDWSARSKNLYWESADDTFVIGGLLAEFLKQKQIDPLTTTLIGHSLGGQVSGVAGDQYRLNTGNSIERIFALDPAGPLFEDTVGYEKPLNERLSTPYRPLQRRTPFLRPPTYLPSMSSVATRRLRRKPPASRRREREVYLSMPKTHPRSTPESRDKPRQRAAPSSPFQPSRWDRQSPSMPWAGTWPTCS